MSPTMRTALAKWKDGSGAPVWKCVRFNTAKALVDRGYLMTASTLSFEERDMVLVLTAAGLSALRQKP